VPPGIGQLGAEHDGVTRKRVGLAAGWASRSSRYRKPPMAGVVAWACTLARRRSASRGIAEDDPQPWQAPRNRAVVRRPPRRTCSSAAAMCRAVGGGARGQTVLRAVGGQVGFGVGVVVGVHVRDGLTGAPAGGGDVVGGRQVARVVAEGAAFVVIPLALTCSMVFVTEERRREADRVSGRWHRSGSRTRLARWPERAQRPVAGGGQGGRPEEREGGAAGGGGERVGRQCAASCDGWAEVCGLRRRPRDDDGHGSSWNAETLAPFDKHRQPFTGSSLRQGRNCDTTTAAGPGRVRTSRASPGRSSPAGLDSLMLGRMGPGGSSPGSGRS
jgi:hypothetical protein